MNRFEQIISDLRGSGKFFAVAKPVYISRAPGRLDLMGGNVDYTGGLVLQATIREATWCAAQLREDTRIVFWNPQMNGEGWQARVEFDLASLTSEAAVRKLVNRCPEVRWTAYVLGVSYLLLCRYPSKVERGTNVYIESEVPLNKGVGSSAAVEVAVMRAIASAYGISLAGVELAEACQWVENVIAESACGIMDQAASVLGEEGHLLPLLCQPCIPRPLVQMPEGLRWWGIDSGVRHAVTGVAYEAARAAAFVGYRMICDWENLPLTRDDRGRIPRYVEPRWNGYLSNIPPSVFRSHYEGALPVMAKGSEILALAKDHPDPFTTIRPDLKYPVRACTRYAVEENQRIETFADLAQGAKSSACDAFCLMGELMFRSHCSYTECGLGCEATDLLVDLVREEVGRGKLFGAKITGGGGGGTVAVLGAEGGEAALRRVVQKYSQARGYAPHVFEGSSMGADHFGIRVLEAQA